MRSKVKNPPDQTNEEKKGQKINEQNIYFKKLKKEQPNKPKERTRRTKYIRAEINETENVHTIESQ